MKKLSVVLPNYNGKELLKDNLPSLINALKKSAVEYEIIVVDDASIDDSVLFLQSEYPFIKILYHKENCGFSKTCNDGIYAAVNELVCLVNTDVTFHADYFKESLKHFENNIDAGAVVGKILNYEKTMDNIIIIDTYKIPFFKRGLFRYKPAENNKNSSEIGVFAPLGCCFVAVKEYLIKLNGYNEIYSPYIWEDTDLAYRMKKNNFKIIYEPLSQVYHKFSSTLSKEKKNKLKLISTRNKFLFFWLNITEPEKWLAHIFFIFVSLISRWIILDWKYYASLSMAVKRFYFFNQKT